MGIPKAEKKQTASERLDLSSLRSVLSVGRRLSAVGQELSFNVERSTGRQLLSDECTVAPGAWGAWKQVQA